MRHLTLFVLFGMAVLSVLTAQGGEVLPSEKLQPVVARMEAALTLFRLRDGKKPPEVSEPVKSLRGEFAEKRAAAPEAGQALYDAAIAVCDMIDHAVHMRFSMQVRAALPGMEAFSGRGKNDPASRRAQEKKVDADWVKAKKDLLVQVQVAFAKLKEAEARTKN